MLVQVAVALMSKMEQSGLTAGQSAATFAAELFDRWGIGDPICNNGVLLILSKHDRQVRSSYLPDALAGSQSFGLAEALHTCCEPQSAH